MPSVTLRDIYDVVERMESKIDKRLTGLEKRVDVVENFNSRVVGIWLAITTIITLGGSWIGQRLFK